MQNNDSLIILIDINKHNVFNNLAQNIKKYIKHSEHIKAVCLASYDTVDGVCSTGCYWENSKTIYKDEMSIDFIRKNWEKKTKKKDITHDVIMNITPRTDQFLFSASSPYEIIYYCNSVNQSIKNIYWAGVDWKMCVRDRPIGYCEIINCYKNNLFQQKINFRTNKNLIATFNHIPAENSKIIDCNLQDNWVETEKHNEWIYQV